MKKTAVIGAGFSSLSAACFLAKEGHDVTVLEKNDTAGGRARKFESDGFVFDMGPSWYWMPDVFESFFAQFGKQVSDYYHLKRLDPSYRVYFSKSEVWDIPSKLEDLYRLFEQNETGSSRQLKKFIEEGAYKYQVGINNLVYKPGLSVTELFDFKLFKGVLKLHVFQSISRYIRKYFRSPRLVQLLEFPVLFLGAAPSHTPALYSLMNYADLALGTWYPMGGMHKIVEGMEALARELGVKFRFNSNVEGFELNGHRIKQVNLKGESLTFDNVVAGADYHYVDQQLLPPAYRNYSAAYWDSRALAPSSLIFYLGVNKKIDRLLHHNLFFDEDFAKHTADIYTHPKWPDNPLFYVCCPSKTDPSVAPEGQENVFILVPVAPDLTDNESVRSKYFDLIMHRLESLTGQSIKDHIIYKRSYAHNDFKADYNSFKGNAYGLANTLLQTAHLKPRIVNKKLINLFYTGQLTVPGPGVPPSLISGQVVANEVIRRTK
ncbi:MAG: phytoene desaturase family protein [Cyclobacteriaceae bacterium]